MMTMTMMMMMMMPLRCFRHSTENVAGLIHTPENCLTQKKIN
jgi:hypothetical protein